MKQKIENLKTMLVIDCNNPYNQATLLNYHRKDQPTFAAWVGSFFNCDAGIVIPKRLDAQYVHDRITAAGVTCEYYVKVSEMGAENTIDNLNINFDVLPPPSHSFASYYTMTLFRAFFTLVPAPKYFDFYKANELDPLGEIVDKTMFLRIVAQDNTLTYWDVSGGIPPTTTIQ